MNSGLPEDGRFSIWRHRVKTGVGSRLGHGALAVTMKTQGEIEAVICERMSRFEQEYMGRGPKDIHAHLLGDLIVVRLRGGK